MIIQEKIFAEKAALLHTVENLVRIPSVESASVPDAPFGQAVKEALVYMLTLGQEDGFVVKNVDNYGGHIEFPGETPDIIGIIAHLDVVPAGDPQKWITPAFDPVIRDNCLFGRGTLDDKGPLAAVYHAMRLLKESGYRPQKTIRLILGCDEETNWNGMRYYLEHERSPVCGFSPDGDFPVIHAEKGLLFSKFSYIIPNRESCNIRLLEFQGGTATNMVPDFHSFTLECGTLLPEILRKAERYLASHPQFHIEISVQDTQLTARVFGRSAHGAMPWDGMNAISIAFSFLDDLIPERHALSPFLTFYQDYIGFDLKGERLGRDFSDDVSGDLIVNTGLAELVDQTISITVNFRYPVTADASEITGQLSKLCEAKGITQETLEVLDPIYCSAGDPLVQTLLETYRQHTNDRDAVPLVSAGATYARAVPNTLAFGAMFPGDTDVCHQANEYISLDRLMSCLEIYTDVIQKLAGGSFEEKQ